MAAKVTKLEKELYLVEVTFDLTSSKTNIEDSGRREANFKLDGFSKGRSYSLNCVCLLSTEESKSLAYDIEELCLSLTSCDTASVRTSFQLSSVFSTFGNGTSKCAFDDCSNGSESWQASISDFDLLIYVERGYSSTGKLDMKLSMEFVQALDKLDALVDFRNDFNVRFKFENGQTLGAHASALMARSPVFKALLGDDTNKEVELRQVEVSEIELDVFRQLLSYLYCGRLTGMLSKSNYRRYPREERKNFARSLIIAAEKYQIDDLVRNCAFILTTLLTKDDAAETLLWSEKYSVMSIKEAALDFIASHFREVVGSSDWDQVIKDTKFARPIAARMFNPNWKSRNEGFKKNFRKY